MEITLLTEYVAAIVFVVTVLQDFAKLPLHVGDVGVVEYSRSTLMY